MAMLMFAWDLGSVAYACGRQAIARDRICRSGRLLQESDGNASSDTGESLVGDVSLNSQGNLYKEVDKIYEDFNNITQNGKETVDEEVATDNTEKLVSYLQKLEYLISKSVEVMASKDHQICILQESVEVLQGSVTSLIEE